MDIEEKYLLKDVQKQVTILIYLARLQLPVSELPLEESSLEYLYHRGAHVLSDLLDPNFFDLYEAQKHKDILELLKEWGYHPKIPNDIAIEDIDFSVRIQNVLAKQGVIFVSQLLSLSPEKVLKFRELGEISVNEIRTQLNLLGYDW